MPTYHYRCPSCGHDFEKFEKMDAKARPKCPKCGTRAERQISGGAGLLFNGSGFYATDYKRPKGSDKAGESSPPAKSDKPETKKPSKPSGGE